MLIPTKVGTRVSSFCIDGEMGFSVAEFTPLQAGLLKMTAGRFVGQLFVRWKIRKSTATLW